MAEEKFPPLTGNDAIDLICLVARANTLRDLGVYGFWVFAHCSTHSDQQEPHFDENPPTAV